MLTSKQRATLRKLANPMDTIIQIGKGGVIEALTIQVKDALIARELIKLRVLETCPLSAREAAALLAQATQSEVVQVIGTKFVLFKRNHKKPQIELD